MSTEEAEPEEAEGAETPTEDEDPEDIGRLRRFARRLMDRKELAEDTKDLLAAVISTSDKAKSDAVRMMGREVRHYLDGLALKDDLLDIATNYRLEVKASFHLEPIAAVLKDEAEDSDEG